MLHRDPHEEQKAAILRFHDTNPGFDSVIVSPMHGQRKLHLTFIETRYSRETNGFKETLSEMVRKHGLLVRNVIPLLAAMFDRTAHEGHFKMEFEWHFVYALYRKHQEFTNDLLPPNTIFLNREALTDFYGPSLFGLGML